MKLERSKKILKISGILIILGSLATIVISVIFLKGNHQGNSMQLLAGPNPQKEGITILIGSGLSMLMSGVISMIEGYLSLLASKNHKYGKLAWLFSLLSMAGAGTNGFAQIREAGLNVSTITNLVLSLGLAALVNFASSRVRKAYEEEVMRSAV